MGEPSFPISPSPTKINDWTATHEQKQLWETPRIHLGSLCNTMKQKYTVFQWRHTNGQQVHERVLYITKHETTMKYHLTFVRMAIIKKTGDVVLVRMWRKGTLVHYWWECKLVQSLWKTIWRFLKEFKNKILHDPAIPLLHICPKELKSKSWTDSCTPMFIAVLFTIVKIWKHLNVCQQMNG